MESKPGQTINLLCSYGDKILPRATVEDQSCSIPVKIIEEDFVCFVAIGVVQRQPLSV